MERLLLFRQHLKQFYKRWELYLLPIAKFLTMLCALLTINQMIGYAAFLNRWAVVLVVSLVASLLPWSAVTYFSAAYLLLHTCALSWEAGVLTGIFLLIGIMLQYLFLPGGSIVIVLIPIAFKLGIPYAVMLLAGLYGGTAIFLPVGFGVFTSYFINNLVKNASLLAESGSVQDSLSKFSQVLASLQANSVMFLTAVAFMVATAVVCLFRKFSMDYAPYVAICIGALADVLISLLGSFFLDITVPYVSLLAGVALSAVIALAVQFWYVAADYSRTEYLQYEDDDYVYYVKAVPKIRMSEQDIRIKEINSREDSEHKDPDVEEALDMLKSLDDKDK